MTIYTQKPGQPKEIYLKDANQNDFNEFAANFLSDRDTIGAGIRIDDDTVEPGTESTYYDLRSDEPVWTIGDDRFQYDSVNFWIE